MAAVDLIAKFADADIGNVASIGNDVATAVASEGVAALESGAVMKALEVSSLTRDLMRLGTPHQT